MSSNADITTGFINAWCALDLDAIMDYFTENAVYTNIPMGPPDILNLAGNVVKLPVMGIFEFTDGKISAWRDYFDMGPFSD